MDEVQVERILQNPKFKEMVRRKSNLSWTLTAIMLFVYVGFMLLVGYNKEFFWRRDDLGYSTGSGHYRFIFHFMCGLRINCE